MSTPCQILLPAWVWCSKASLCEKRWRHPELPTTRKVRNGTSFESSESFSPFFLTAIMGCLRDYFSLFLSIYSSQQNLHLLFQFSIGTSYITFLLWLQIGFFYTIGYCSFYWSSIDFDPILWDFFNRGQIFTKYTNLGLLKAKLF